MGPLGSVALGQVSPCSAGLTTGVSPASSRSCPRRLPGRRAASAAGKARGASRLAPRPSCVVTVRRLRRAPVRHRMPRPVRGWPRPVRPAGSPGCRGGHKAFALGPAAPSRARPAYLQARDACRPSAQHLPRCAPYRDHVCSRTVRPHVCPRCADRGGCPARSLTTE